MVTNPLLRTPLLLMAALITLPLAVGCRDEKKVDVAAGLDPTHMASVRSENVATFISDSGYAKYRIVTPLWLIYDEVDTPYWQFPQGLYLQQYDRKMNVVASVAADSARYLKRERVWRLDGNVEMHKEPKEVFLTQQLFWDERREKIYSDSFIHVETASHILEGYGFISNSALTTYRVVDPTGLFPIHSEDENRSQQTPYAPPGVNPDADPGAPVKSVPVGNIRIQENT